MFAAELAAEWAPELDLVGTVAAGVPADLTAADVEVGISPVFLVIAGYDAAYPDMEPSWVLTPAGEAELDVVDQGCDYDLHLEGRDRAELLNHPAPVPNSRRCCGPTTPARCGSTHRSCSSTATPATSPGSKPSTTRCARVAKTSSCDSSKAATSTQASPPSISVPASTGSNNASPTTSWSPRGVAAADAGLPRSGATD